MYAKNKIHEAKTTMLIEKILKPGDTFFDLGANIGYFSLLASKLVGGDGLVYSFEPEIRNFTYLSRNKELNDYTQMHPYNNAVSDKEEMIKLYICPYDTGHHTINQEAGIISYETTTDYNRKDIVARDIAAVTIDSFVAKNKIDKIDLIKMDVEGAEFLALNGMRRTLASNKSIKMIFEFFPLLIENMGSSPTDFLHSIVHDFDFDMYEVFDDYYADHGEMSKLLKKIEEPESIAQGYADNKMFHINLFLIKKDDRLPNL
ncbi:MAG: FkbM family methyltransferase [Spirochaetales bacterium]|nr:FkbM family methyltransferase [Spirochaetales bacterium]